MRTGISAAKSFVLIIVLLLAAPSAARLLLPNTQPAHARENHGSTSTATDTLVMTRTITPVLVPTTKTLGKPSLYHITPETLPLNNPSATPASSGSITPTSPTPAAATPPATASFPGLHITVDCILPPDSDGTVGPTYYAAFVNGATSCTTQVATDGSQGNVGFYCKSASGGACTSKGVLAHAFYYSQLFNVLSTNCNSGNAGSDPQIVYDSSRDRYLFVDITVTSPFQLCIAATLSNDPVGGSYCIASYPTVGNSLPDYDKAGVWLDGFYVGYNPSGDSRTAVFNKDDLEACTPSIRTQDFDMGSDTHEGDNQCTPQPNHIFRPVPATYNIFAGSTPVLGEPEFIVATFCLTSHLYVFTLHVDWSNSANSVLTRAFIGVQTDAFAPTTVSSPANPLDTLHLHLMTPAPYFKDSSGNEYLWTTKTVRGSSTSLSAIAWYQLKVVNNNAAGTTVQNQNIWNPDSTSRLEAAASFDRQGNVLMDYTQVSSAQDPAVAYAGRLANDTANTLGQTETIMLRGSMMGSGACGSQSPCHRWGDYSSNFIDPDGCTFWFTHEYYNTTDVWQWNTRIGATNYSSCTPLNYNYGVSPSSLSFSSGVGQASAAQNVTVSNTGTGPLVLQGLSINGTNAADFSLSSDKCSNSTIKASSSCTFQVTCTPSASGTRTAAVNIFTNKAAGDKTALSLTCASSTALTSPTISVSPSTIDSGQSSTVSTTISFSGGISPYTCQWLQKSPGAASYGNLASSFSCSTSNKPTTSTGTLSTMGTWSFEFQVTDNTPTTIASNAVNVTVSPALTVNTPSASPSSIFSGQSSTLSATFSGGTSPYTCQWLQKAPGASSFSNLGGSSSCASPASISTGALTTTGTWSFELQVTDTSGSPVTVISTAAAVIVNTPPPLLVSFAVSPSVSVAMFKTNFTATATGGTGGYSYSWAFGDTAIGTGQLASHIYSLNGTYTVTLTVTDSGGTHAQASNTVRVDLNPDFDRDGVVDIVDAAHVAFVYGSSCGDALYDPRFDVNWDCKVNILDAAIVAFYFGRTVGS